MPDAITATGGFAATNPPPSPGGALDSVSSDTFLKLLVAQLKYQNPLEPTDSSAFMAQTAQFTMVEKISALAKQSQSTLLAERGVMASSFIGKKITAVGPDGTDVTGVVNKIRLGTDGPWLQMGSTEVSLDAVREVTSP